MRDPSDVESTIDLATGLIQVGWPGGMLTLRYAGIPTVTAEAQEEISTIMEQFSSDCQMMLVWFVGILNSRGAIRHHLDGIAERDQSLTISNRRPDGRVESVFAKVPIEKVIDAFSDAGEFEHIYAKSFVVFTFQIWEEVARPRIATALKVAPNHVEANLMGEWRRLRNWLIHRTKNAEREYFDNAPMLVRLLGSQPNDPSLTAEKVFILMQLLNRMRLDVNPNSVEFGLELATLDPGFMAEVASTLEPGEGMHIPAEASMYPSAVYIILDGTTATIHEQDCSHMEVQFKNASSGRWLRVISREVAIAVTKHLGKHEHRCEHCTPIGE